MAGARAVLHNGAIPDIWDGQPIMRVDTLGTDTVFAAAARACAWRSMEVVALRAVFVACPEMEAEIGACGRSRAVSRARGRRLLGGRPRPFHPHLAPCDLAGAFRLALELPTQARVRMPLSLGEDNPVAGSHA